MNLSSWILTDHRPNTTLHLLGLLLLALWLSLPLRAQTGEPRHNLSIGINGGINMSSVSFSPKVKQKNLMGPAFGLTFRYINERWFGMLCGVQGEINLSKRGWDEFYEDYPQLEYTRKLTYAEIPLMAHIGFGKENGLMKFFIHAGPQFSYFISDSSSIGGDWENYRYHQEQHTLEVEHKLDYGIIGGAGFEFHTGIGNFLAEGRYYLGLGDIFGNTKHDDFSRSANGGISIRVTYLFDLKK